MTPQYRIFYSWQSDDPTSRELIKKALDEVIEKLKEKRTHVIIEQGGGDCGFISIEESIRIKIRRSDIFVGDVTPVGLVNEKSKLLPNANVMFEMGLATECMSPNRILAVAMDGDWKEENMPFDFNHNTMLRFDKNKGQQLLYEAIINKIRETDKISRNENIRFFSKRLLSKNIESTKFLPDTFLENIDAKDLARCFVFPFKMYPLVYNKLQKLNFDFYNKTLMQKGVKEKIEFNIDKWNLTEKPVDIEFLQNNINAVNNIVRQLLKKIPQHEHDSYFAFRKLEKIDTQLNAMSKKIMMITSAAGQGKTNFICDIVKNVLKNNFTPFIFINAYELSAETLAKSIAEEYNFIGNNSLEDVLLKAEKYCNQHLQYLIIVIDGLNEHPKQGPFKINLIRVLNAICKYKLAKVLMTCRKEYYKSNYQSFQNELENNLIENKLPPTSQHVQNEESNNEICLLNRYGKHFNTGVPTSSIVRSALLSNMLLLRIFFETHQGKNVEDINQIDYIELYKNYYKLQCEKIQQIILQNVYVANANGMAMKIFHRITTWMIEHDIFWNLPLEDIQKTMTADEQLCFTSFMSTNLILQQDESEGNIGISSVLNFTYEAMRDYIIARHLIDEVLVADEKKFEELVNRYTNNDNDQAEGTKRFLFLYAKSKKDDKANMLLMQQKWYESSFIEYIWEVPEENITTNDINKIKEHLRFHPDNKAKLLAYQYWSPQKNKKINLNILLDILNEKKEEEQKNYLEQIWPSKPNHYQMSSDTERKQFLKALRFGIDTRNTKENKQELDVLKKLETYLSKDERKSNGTTTREQKEKFKKNDISFVMFEYDYGRLLLKVHNGTKEEFLSKAGVKEGFAREMFETIYDSIFAEADDVNSLYENFYSNEYQNLQHFLEMRYSLPQNIAPKYADVCKSSDYRLIDFDAHSYGGNGVRVFLMDNDFKERIYKWLNWEDYEN